MSDGYRIWYDEGIDPGTEWPEFIAEHLCVCEVCIAFISSNSVASHNCRREINFAIEEKKTVIAVYLEELELTAGMRMQLNALQAIHKYMPPWSRHLRLPLTTASCHPENSCPYHPCAQASMIVKYSLSIEEAAEYYGIGEKRLRNILSVHENEPFILEIGSHIRIKRKLFEDFLDEAVAV